MNIITLNNLSKSYDKQKPLLKNLNLKLNEAEFYFLCGSTGSGKTTILNMIHLSQLPTSGEILFYEQVLSPSINIQKHRANIGYVYQDHKLLNQYSAEYNISLPLYISGWKNKAIKQRVAELAESLGISALLKQKVESLSGGEKQLVSIARAIVNNPKLLLVDEPSAHLDRASALKILNILLNIQKSGVTIILATHDLELMKSVNDVKILLIEDYNCRILEA